MEHQRWQPEDRQPFSLELQRPPQRLQCPRCESNDTKFCYYNNYSMTQPRYYCRTCKRFWTQGGALRNIPEGGRRKKAKTTKSSSLPRSPSSGKAPAVHSAEVNCQVPVFASAVGINAYYYGGAGNSSTLGGHLGDLHPGGTIPSNLSLNPEVMVPDFSLMRPLFDIHLQQYVQQLPEPHLTLHQNLMNNGGVLIQGQPHPAGWSMQQISAQQVVASFNNTPAMTELAPAPAPTPTSAAATTETANWDSSSLEPSASPTPSSPPPPSPFAFM